MGLRKLLGLSRKGSKKSKHKARPKSENDVDKQQRDEREHAAMAVPALISHRTQDTSTHATRVESGSFQSARHDVLSYPHDNKRSHRQEKDIRVPIEESQKTRSGGRTEQALVTSHAADDNFSQTRPDEHRVRIAGNQSTQQRMVDEKGHIGSQKEYVDPRAHPNEICKQNASIARDSVASVSSNTEAVVDSGERHQTVAIQRCPEKDEEARLVELMMSGEPIEAASIMGEKDAYRPTVIRPTSFKHEEKESTVTKPAQVVMVKGNEPRQIPKYVTADEMKEENYFYKMNNPRRGVALIFNIGEFLPVTGMKRRNGYEVDGELMRDTFSKLGFDVQYHTNQTTAQINKRINRVAEEFHGDADCFVCVIMTHGNRSTSDLVFTKDGVLTLDFIVERFNGINCPTLAGKPKLFFVQACRGDKMDQGQDLPFVDDDFDQTDASSKTRKIPVEADILMSQATTPGYLSFRNSGRGSIYIRCLTKALATYGYTEDLLTVLTRVNAMVAFEFESNSSSQPAYSGKKQMPAFTSQLTKRLIFSAPPAHLK